MARATYAAGSVQAALPWTMLLMIAPQILRGITQLLVHKSPEQIGGELGGVIGGAVPGPLARPLGDILRATAEAVAPAGPR